MGFNPKRRLMRRDLPTLGDLTRHLAGNRATRRDKHAVIDTRSKIAANQQQPKKGNNE